MQSNTRAFLPHAAVLVIAAFATSAAAQTTLTVGPSGQYASIQAAIVAATSGDTIAVAPGTYHESIRYLGKNVAIVATGATAQNSHVIDAQGIDTVVRFVAGEGPTARLEGFTITGGHGAAGEPGGIDIYLAQPTIRGCWIVGNVGGSQPVSPNTVLGDGGTGGIQMRLANHHPTLQECTFLNNQGGQGRAYYVSNGTAMVAALGGTGGVSIGAINWTQACSLSIRGCHFAGNVGRTGAPGYSPNPFPMTLPARHGAGAISVTTSRLNVTIAASSFQDNIGAGNAPGAIDVALPGATWPTFAPGGTLLVEDCVMSGNQNGTVRLENSVTMTLRRCLLHANVGTTVGAFLFDTYLGPESAITIVDSELIGNSGGPAFESIFGGWPCSIQRSIVFGHDSGTTPLVALNWGHGTFNNNVFWGNSSPYPWSTYSCIEGGSTGTGTIALHPQFVRDPSPGSDAIWGTPDDDLGDLRLQPTSPCIDAGDPRTAASGLDMGAHPRLLDGDLDGTQRIDMGAHEFGHVRLALSTPTPQQLTLEVTGSPNLLAVVAMGMPATQTTMLAPLGELFLDLGAPIIVAPIGALPVTLNYALPGGALELMFQAVVLGNVGGNVSSPQLLHVQ